ncbi:MAG: hypothetical protein K0S01_3805 [Herbinix sp.]|nr:hypothetical protein [Herbinix sp.]
MDGYAVYVEWGKVVPFVRHFGFVIVVAENSEYNRTDQMKRRNADQCWLKCMELGEKTGCHQMPERSFFIKGYQMPVCARCTGVIFGYLIAIPGFLMFGFSKFAAFGGSLTLLIDWLLQTMKIKKSSNSRRLITGILGGYGIMLIQLFVLRQIAMRLARHKFHN